MRIQILVALVTLAPDLNFSCNECDTSLAVDS